MVRRKTADVNMGEFSMTAGTAKHLIEKAREGLPVNALDLQRAIMTLYKGKEPRKLVIPVLHSAVRMAINCVLLHNLGNARYRQLKEKQDAERTAASSEDEPSAVRRVDEASS